MRRIYARAGIPEYWVVDLVNDRIEKFWALHDAAYQETAVVTSGQLSPIAIPNVCIDVAAVLKRFNV